MACLGIDVRSRIVNMWRANFKVKDIMKRLAEEDVKVSRTAIYNLLAKFRKTESIGDIKRKKMADRAIKVAGYFASLSALGFPMLLTLQLQQSDLRLNAAMWRAQSSKAGFSISFFWPVANPPDPAAGLNNLKKKKRRTKSRKARLAV